MWRREVLDFHGSAYSVPLPVEQGSGLGKPLKMIAHPVRDRIPIYLAALGQKNVQLTAEIADGWIPMLVMPERIDKVWGQALADGLARRSPDLSPLEVVAGGIVAIGEHVCQWPTRSTQWWPRVVPTGGQQKSPPRGWV